MDIISKIDECWNAGLDKEIICDDGSKVNIRDGVNHVFKQAEPTNADKDRNRAVAKNREEDNDIRSK